MVDFIELEIILLLTLSNVLVGLGITFAVMRNRLKSLLFSYAGEFLDTTLSEIREKPQVLVPILTPAIKLIAKEFTGPAAGGGGGGLKLTGNKIVDNIIGSVATRFLEKGTEKAAEAATSPFG